MWTPALGRSSSPPSFRPAFWSSWTFEDAEKAVNYGAAHGALAMTTPGDTTMASLKEVEGIVGGAGARVQR